MAEIIFGDIIGVSEGDIFSSREDLKNAGLHRNTQQGIDGNGEFGVASIVLSGGYEDDVDFGDEILYTGVGGQNSQTKKQIEDQSWEKFGNKGLLVSELHGLPVRVTRGHNHKSQYSPKNGYQYGGLYQVVEHSWKKRDDGFGVCRFKLIKISSIANLTTSDPVADENTILTGDNGPTSRIPTTVLRIVRDNKLSRKIKRLYNYTCQVCGIRIDLNGVGYAEAAHIKPLGRPHNGSDDPGNLLCLCPNHHVMFDKKCFTINPDFSLVGINGKLHIHKSHIINKENILYHFNYSQTK